MTKHRKTREESSLPASALGLPLVAIVGRPNVGKSTLFNRLARRKLAIVHDEPGVTRDRNYASTTAFGRNYTLIDTGGFDPESDDVMKAGINEHVKAAIAEADVIVFVTDGAQELTAADRAAVGLLRRSKKPVFYAANKADSPKVDPEAFELYRLGVKDVFPVSALHGRGMGELEEAVVQALPPPPEQTEEDEAIMRVSIVGRPNAGKSSLLNRLLGENRMLVDDKPGTTRDAIDALVVRGDDKFIFVDTAGIRKKGKVTKAGDAVESISVLQAVRSIERSQICVLLVDGSDGVAEQDAKILGLCEDRGRAMIVAINKSDLLDKDARKRAEAQARDKLTFAPYVSVVHISAKTGKGVGDLLAEIKRVHACFNQRVTTGELNRFFEKVIETRSPPTQGGKAPRLYFITQVESAPPLFVVVSSAPEAVHFSYQRYVVNQLRKHFGYDGVPVRVAYRNKRRGKKTDDAKA